MLVNGVLGRVLELFRVGMILSNTSLLEFFLKNNNNNTYHLVKIQYPIGKVGYLVSFLMIK